MLSRLRAKAAAADLEVNVVEGPAEQPPPGRYDAVIERHLIWTLPDPRSALRAWREAAPAGRLVLFEGMWGGADPLYRVRGLGQRLLSLRAFGRPAHGGHHAEYPESVRSSLPLGSGTSPSEVAHLVSDSGWEPVRLRRLRDIEWAASVSLPWPDRLLGVPPRFAIVAGS
jgi:hypothetical protein